MLRWQWWCGTRSCIAGFSHDGEAIVVCRGGSIIVGCTQYIRIVRCRCSSDGWRCTCFLYRNRHGRDYSDRWHSRHRCHQRWQRCHYCRRPPRTDCRGSHHRRRHDHRFALFDIVFALVLATHALSSETLFIFDFDKKFPLKSDSDAALKEVIGWIVFQFRHPKSAEQHNQIHAKNLETCFANLMFIHTQQATMKDLRRKHDGTRKLFSGVGFSVGRHLWKSEILNNKAPS